MAAEPKDPMPRGARDAIALGPPSVLSTWAFDLLREVCALIPNRAAIRAIDREDPLEPDGDRIPLIYLSHFPSPLLLAECGKGTAPILLCHYDPVDSIRYLQRSSNVSVVEALRLQTASAARQGTLSLARIELGIPKRFEFGESVAVKSLGCFEQDNALNLARLIRRRAGRVVAIRGHALPLDKFAQALCADLHVLRPVSRVAVPIERDIARVAPGSTHFAVPSWVFALTGGGCSPFGFGRKSHCLRAIADFIALYDEALA